MRVLASVVIAPRPAELLDHEILGCGNPDGLTEFGTRLADLPAKDFPMMGILSKMENLHAKLTPCDIHNPAEGAGQHLDLRL